MLFQVGMKFTMDWLGADGTSIRFEDGELYRPFGTTVYGLIHQKKDLIVQTIDSILHSPFDKVRICLFQKVMCII